MDTIQTPVQKRRKARTATREEAKANAGFKGSATSVTRSVTRTPTVGSVKSLNV